MKNLFRHKVFVLVMMALITLLTVPQFSKAQGIYKLVESPDVSVKVLGSSNVHDWTMTSTVMESQGEFKIEGSELRGLSAFGFSVAFKNLKSGHSSMDSRTYKSVNAPKYPNVTYKLNSATVTTIEKNKYLIKAKGDLTISGKTQPVTLEVTAVINADNTITCSGSEKIKLTDYGIKPPSFMLGTMKVADDLTIQFTLIYKK
jgi:polyisoprenoid-binding protein YceI